jgi:hypothetical protein
MQVNAIEEILNKYEDVLVNRENKHENIDRDYSILLKAREELKNIMR